MKRSFKPTAWKAVSILAVGIAMLFVLSLDAFADTHTWDGSTDTDWGTADNWDVGAVPANGDDIIIPAGLTNYPVFGTGDGDGGGDTLSVGTLLIEDMTSATDALKIDATGGDASITVTSSLTIGENAKVYVYENGNDAALTLNGNATIEGYLYLGDGTNDAGAITLGSGSEDTITIATTGTIATLDNAGSSGAVTVNANVVSYGSIDLYYDSSDKASLTTGTDGMYIALSGTSNEFDGVTLVAGTTTIRGITSSAAASLTIHDTDTIDDNGETLQITQTSTANDFTVTFDGDTANITITGTLRLGLNSGSSNYYAGNVTFSDTGGTVTVAATGEIYAGYKGGTGGTLTVSGADLTSANATVGIDLYYDATNYVTLSLSDGKTVTVASTSDQLGPLTLADSGSAIIKGNVAAAAAAVTIYDSDIVESGKTLYLTRTGAGNNFTVTINGGSDAIDIDGTLSLGNGSNIAPSSVVLTTPDQINIGSSGSLVAGSAAGTGCTLTLGADVSSSGTIDLYSAAAHYAALTVNDNITVSISGSSNQIAGLTLSSKTLSITGSGVLDLYGNISISDALSGLTTSSGVLLYVKGAITIDNGNGGNFTSGGYLQFDANTTLEVGQGTNSIASTKVSSTKTVTINTDGASDSNVLEVTGSLTIEGTLQNSTTPSNYDKLIIKVTNGKSISVNDEGILTIVGDNSNGDRIVLRSSVDDPSADGAEDPTWYFNITDDGQGVGATAVTLTGVVISDADLVISDGGDLTFNLTDALHGGGCNSEWFKTSYYDSGSLYAPDPTATDGDDPEQKADSPSNSPFDLGYGSGDWSDSISYEIYLAPVNTYRYVSSSSDPVASSGIKVQAYYGSSSPYTYSNTVTGSTNDWKVNTVGVPPGNYYVYMRRTDAVDTGDYYYVVSPFTVKVARALFISGDKPMGDDDVAGVSYRIEWSDDDEAYGLTGTIDLYYATSDSLTTATQVESQGTAIVTGMDEYEDDSNNPGYGNYYDWTPSGVSAGTYYIYVVWRSGGITSVDVSGSIEVQQASVKITRPYSSNITASGGYFTIEWSDSALDGITGAEIYFFYSTSNSLHGSATPKAMVTSEINTLAGKIKDDPDTYSPASYAITINSTGISLDNDGSSDRYVWDLSNVDNSSNCYIYALVKYNGSYVAGYGPSGSSSAKYVTVSHTPSIVVTSPAKNLVVSSSYTIRWRDKWDGGTGTVELYYSSTGTYTTASDVRTNCTLIASGLNEGGDSGSYEWTGVSSLPTNTAYYIYAVLEAGSTDAVSRSVGTIKRASDFTVQLISGASDPAVGDTFPVTIKIDTNSTTILSAAIYLSFNPNYINLVSETSPFTVSGWTSATEFSNTGSNTDGTADLVVGVATSGSSFSTSTTFATVQFRVIQSGNTNVMLSPESSGRVTMFIDSNQVKHYPTASQIVKPTNLGIISGKVALEGRTNYSTQITFELRKPGSLGNTDDWTVPDGLDEDANTPGVQVTTRADGSFVLTDIPTGKWELTAKAPHYLRGLAYDSSNNGYLIVSAERTATVSYFSDDSGTTQYLKGGECYDSTYAEDNDVDIDDLTVFANNFGLSTSEALTAADIDGDGEIGLEDFVMIASNWGSDGIDPDSSNLGVANGDFAPAANLSNASIRLVGLPEKVKLGQEYRVLVVGRNLDRTRGYAFNLNYDPAAIEVSVDQGNLGLTGSYPLFIAKDNGDTTSVASVLTGKEIDGASGDVVLAVITVKPNAKGTMMMTLADAMLIPVNGRAVPVNTVTGTFKVLKPADQFALLQNYPNPFNPETWIPYALKEDAHVQIRIFDSAGKLIRTIDQGYQEAAEYFDRDEAAYWDGRNDNGERISSGVYFYQIVADKFTAMRKMVILK